MSNIPLVDLSRVPQNEKKKIISRVNQIIQKGDFILGNDVALFEKKFAKYIGQTYCIGVNSGTDAIMLGLLALGVKKNDEVIVPAMTFIATAAPLVMLGAKPVLVDINYTTGLIDVGKIENAITKKTKGIIVVYLNGNVCDMKPILKIAKKHSLFVLEDASQAHGSLYQNKKAGSFGQISTFSFYPGKNLGALGDGGAVLTSQKNLAKKITLLRDQGQVKKYKHQIMGYNSRLDTIHAAALLIHLQYLEINNKKRNELANIYISLLKNLPLTIIKVPQNTKPNYHLFVIQTKKREKLEKFLKQNGILTGKHYPYPLHLQEALNNLGYKKGDFPEAERYASNCLSLPIFPQLAKNEVKKICLLIKQFFSQ